MPSKPKEEVAFKKGDTVKARWSGSNVYYEAKILDLLSKHCKVQFDDGSVSSVKFSDVQAIKPEKDDDYYPRTRGRPRSRSSSAGRKMESRSRSPSRKADKKTATKTEKKTPTTKTEKKTPTTKAEKKTPTTKTVSKASKSEENSNSRSKDEPDRPVKTTEDRASTRSSITRNNTNLKKAYADATESISNTIHLRTSSRLAAIHVKQSELKKNAISKDAKYSDDEDDEEEEVQVQAAVSKQPKRSLQIIFFSMTLLKIILIPVSLLLLIFACSRKQCTILEVPQFYARWKDFENSIRLPFLAVAAFHAIQCVLSLIPLGKKAKGFPFSSNVGAKEYRLNGILSLMLCTVAFGICSYYGMYMNWGYDKFRTIAMSSVIYCTMWAIVLHIYAHVKGNWDKTSKVPLIGNFYDGSYVNPVVYKVIDVKTTFIRTGLIGLVLLNLSILLKCFLAKGFITIPLALTASMQIFFVLDLMIREEKLLSTAMYTSDTVGYSFLLTTGFSVPLALGLQNLFHFIHDAKAATIPHWCSAAMVCLFFCGYYIYMTSSNLKHNFRRNPYSPSMTDVDSIPTSKKKRLISSSWWSLVRHPNYLGLLIMAIAWTLPCGFTHFVPFGPLILLIGALIIRCFRVENECREKYGPAWQNYTEKVRNRLIPYVF